MIIPRIDLQDGRTGAASAPQNVRRGCFGVAWSGNVVRNA
jgi:hypothetical protein